jgi:K+-sensing histidine kinase KdpD
MTKAGCGLESQIQRLIFSEQSQNKDGSMAGKKETQTAPSYDDLVRQNLALQKELERLTSTRENIWVLFVEASRRLQVSSASIKAAVSSLLNYEIFWDPANQHEFLETIDSSVDKLTRLVMILSLAFRAEAGSLELKREPQSLQEILAVVQGSIAARHPKLQARFYLPKEGKPVMVDYEYLTIAIGLLFELFDADQKNRSLRVHAVEHPQSWYLDVNGVDRIALELIQNMYACKTDVKITSQYPYLPEHILGLHVACEIIHLQEIDLAAIVNPDGTSVLRLVVPAFVNNP